MRTTDNIDIGIGDAHIEATYIWHDADDMVEFGWSFEWTSLFTNLWVYDARAFNGDYAQRYDFHPSIADMHEFRNYYDGSDGRYHFDYDGDRQPFARDPIWAEGRPFTNQELTNQCNGGHAHFWHLERKSSSGAWVDWSGTHWNCDTETGYGFTYHSDTDFTVDARSDTFAGPCDVFS